MKTYLIIFTLMLLAACGSNDAGSGADENREDTLAPVYGWEATLNDSTGRMQVTKSIPGGPDTLTIASVIAYLNQKNPNVQLQYLKTGGDTLYVAIPDAMYLTQQMGSTGPQLFFAESVYNLTEIPGIRNVNYDFEEGDHASPAVLGRDNFKNE